MIEVDIGLVADYTDIAAGYTGRTAAVGDNVLVVPGSQTNQHRMGHLEIFSS